MYIIYHEHRKSWVCFRRVFVQADWRRRASRRRRVKINRREPSPAAAEGHFFSAAAADTNNIGFGPWLVRLM
jgi:hypothetical protein